MIFERHGVFDREYAFAGLTSRPFLGKVNDRSGLRNNGIFNKHVSRYTPSDRFATAVFIVLSRESGELTYVNAGHNAPIVFSSGSTTFLEATGPPLELFVDAE